jgi:hypothetical protein
MNNNPYSLFVNVENASCVVEFDIDRFGDINYYTWEVFYQTSVMSNTWVVVNDLIHDKTWESIEKQIKAQWGDVEEQQREYYERY